MQNNTKLGIEVPCNLPGRYISLVKESLDPGTNSFDVCTFGVMAGCDCQTANIGIYSSDAYTTYEEVQKG